MTSQYIKKKILGQKHAWEMEPPKKAFSLFIYSNSIERKNSIVISSQKYELHDWVTRRKTSESGSLKVSSLLNPVFTILITKYKILIKFNSFGVTIHYIFHVSCFLFLPESDLVLNVCQFPKCLFSSSLLGPDHRACLPRDITARWRSAWRGGWRSWVFKAGGL